MREHEGRGPPRNAAVPSAVVVETATKNRPNSGHGLSAFTGRS
jgi:hypothetical protein